MSTAELIAEHSRAIAETISAAANDALARVLAAEQEAIERINSISAPAEYDYAAAALYLGIPKRTLELRVQERAIAFRRDGRRVFFTQSGLDEYKAGLSISKRPVRPLSL